jgi:hypothetical protein
MNMDNVLDVAEYIRINEKFIYGKTFAEEIKKMALEIGINLTQEECCKVYKYVRLL